MSAAVTQSVAKCNNCGHQWDTGRQLNYGSDLLEFVKVNGSVLSCIQCGKADHLSIVGVKRKYGR